MKNSNEATTHIHYMDIILTYNQRLNKNRRHARSQNRDWINMIWNICNKATRGMIGCQAKIDCNDAFAYDKNLK